MDSYIHLPTLLYTEHGSTFLVTFWAISGTYPMKNFSYGNNEVLHKVIGRGLHDRCDQLSRDKKEPVGTEAVYSLELASCTHNYLVALDTAYKWKLTLANSVSFSNACCVHTILHRKRGVLKA